jgi:hypothetical protein
MRLSIIINGCCFNRSSTALLLFDQRWRRSRRRRVVHVFHRTTQSPGSSAAPFMTMTPEYVLSVPRNGAFVGARDRNFEKTLSQSNFVNFLNF